MLWCCMWQAEQEKQEMQARAEAQKQKIQKEAHVQTQKLMEAMLKVELSRALATYVTCTDRVPDGLQRNKETCKSSSIKWWLRRKRHCRRRRSRLSAPRRRYRTTSDCFPSTHCGKPLLSV